MAFPRPDTSRIGRRRTGSRDEADGGPNPVLGWSRKEEGFNGADLAGAPAAGATADSSPPLTPRATPPATATPAPHKTRRRVNT